MNDFVDDYYHIAIKLNEQTKYFYCPYCGYKLGIDDLGMINVIPNSPTGLHIKIIVGAITCPECGKTSKINK